MINNKFWVLTRGKSNIQKTEEEEEKEEEAINFFNSYKY